MRCSCLSKGDCCCSTQAFGGTDDEDAFVERMGIWEWGYGGVAVTVDFCCEVVVACGLSGFESTNIDALISSSIWAHTWSFESIRSSPWWRHVVDSLWSRATFFTVEGGEQKMLRLNELLKMLVFVYCIYMKLRATNHYGRLWQIFVRSGFGSCDISTTFPT